MISEFRIFILKIFHILPTSNNNDHDCNLEDPEFHFFIITKFTSK